MLLIMILVHKSEPELYFIQADWGHRSQPLMDFSPCDYWRLLRTGRLVSMDLRFTCLTEDSHVDSLYTITTISPMVVGIVTLENMNITLECIVLTSEVEITNHFADSVQRFLASGVWGPVITPNLLNTAGGSVPLLNCDAMGTKKHGVSPR